MFRVIPAAEFLQTFASDRSHMLTKDGQWMSPPPVYPPIKTEGIETLHISPVHTTVLEFIYAEDCLLHLDDKNTCS